MALSDKQKHKVLFYLGWAGRTIQTGSTHFNSVVNDRLGTVASPLDAESEKIVKNLIECIEAIDTKLKAAQCRASTESVDKIKLNKDEIPTLKKERRRYVRELSDWLDIPLVKSGGANVSVIV